MKRLHIFCKELLRRCTRHLDVVHIAKQALNKAGAVDPIFISAAIFVRCLHPFINERVERDVCKTIRIDLQIGGILGDRFFFRTDISDTSRINGFYHYSLVLVG